ncbi:terminase, partial [bacterium]|nr:terminase [bacterium]
MARLPYSYQSNPNLPNEQYRHAFTQKELDEYMRCADDPVYFAKKYIKIINVDRGLIPFDMWDFQEKMLQTFHDNRFSICKLPRQVGKSTTSVAYILHQVLFNENFVVAILANRAPTARELLGKLKLAFEYLPMFLKQGIKEWNKGSIYLANGSRVLADSTSGSSVRGFSFNLIFLDEFAFVPNNIAEEFFNSTYPTISSGKTSKVVIVSTPNGMNLFYKMWTQAVEKVSTYQPIEIHWSMVPGRDEAWAAETIRNTSQRQFDQEFGCEFLGSTNTLISGAKLATLAIKQPIESKDFLDVYELPQPKRTYVITVDVAEGQGLDYSSFSVFDVTEIPYRQIAKYRNNEIAPLLFPTVIYSVARRFNDAFILVEINSIGLQVADILHFELGYENLLKFQ